VKKTFFRLPGLLFRSYNSSFYTWNPAFFFTHAVLRVGYRVSRWSHQAKPNLVFCFSCNFRAGSLGCLPNSLITMLCPNWHLQSLQVLLVFFHLILR
jgi:hypothetical protein